MATKPKSKKQAEAHLSWMALLAYMDTMVLRHRALRRTLTTISKTHDRFEGPGRPPGPASLAEGALQRDSKRGKHMAEEAVALMEKDFKKWKKAKK